MNLTDSPKKHGSYDSSVLFFFLFISFFGKNTLISHRHRIFSVVSVSRFEIPSTLLLYSILRIEYIDRKGTNSQSCYRRVPYFLNARSLEIPSAFVDKSDGNFPLEKIKSRRARPALIYDHPYRRLEVWSDLH